jgi:hypothetical protein
LSIFPSSFFLFHSFSSERKKYLLVRKEEGKRKKKHPDFTDVSLRTLFSLFTSPSPQIIAETEAEELREKLLTRARTGDVSVLDEAQANQALYHEVLTALLTHGSDVPALAAYVSRHVELRTSTQLAQAFIKHWDSSPTRNELATMLRQTRRTTQSRSRRRSTLHRGDR